MLTLRSEEVFSKAENKIHISSANKIILPVKKLSEDGSVERKCNSSKSETITAPSLPYYLCQFLLQTIKKAFNAH